MTDMSAERAAITRRLAEYRERRWLIRSDVIQAHRLGIPVAEIAATTGLSRQTVYNWITSPGGRIVA